MQIPGLESGIPGHVSVQARFVVFLLGLALCAWAAINARNRTVLIPTITLLLSLGIGVIAFAIYPAPFDKISYMLGVAYPPIIYILIALTALLIVILHLAMRLSITDERCRKLTQEIALLRTEMSKVANSPRSEPR
jgi:hypothetical protein